MSATVAGLADIIAIMSYRQVIVAEETVRGIRLALLLVLPTGVGIVPAIVHGVVGRCRATP